MFNTGAKCRTERSSKRDIGAFQRRRKAKTLGSKELEEYK
jgi:hypothetical protein